MKKRLLSMTLALLVLAWTGGTGISFAADEPAVAQETMASEDNAPNEAAKIEEGETESELQEADAKPAGKSGAEEGERLQYTTRYRLDSRYMNQSEGDSGFDIMAAEAEVYGSYGNKIDFGLQIPFYTAMKGRGKEMHFGNAYAVIKGEIGKPTFRVGQFVVPFGNLVNYETHTRVFQTLYANSLGIRIDPGVEVEGYLGDAEYQLALTNGNGPWRKDIDGNKVVTARISKKLEIGDNDLRIGVSGLKGRLPVFSLMDDPLMDGRGARLVNVRTGEAVGQGDRAGFADKTRYGVDVEYYRGIDLIRAEFVAGSDEGRSVDGQWVQVEHPLNYKTSLVGLAQRWRQSNGNFTGWGIGLEHKAAENKTWRLAYENRRIKESLFDPEMGDFMPMKMNMNMYTLQYLVEF